MRPSWSISVRLWEIWKNSSIIHRSTFGRCPSRRTVHALNGLPRMNVGAIKSRMFSLIHHLKPDSFDSHRVHQNAHEKLLEIFLKPYLSGYGRLSNSLHLFIPFVGNPWVFPWCHHFITPLPGEAPPTLYELSNQLLAHQNTLMHVHKLQNIPPFCHSSSRFWRGNISDALVAS